MRKQSCRANGRADGFPSFSKALPLTGTGDSDVTPSKHSRCDAMLLKAFRSWTLDGLDFRLICARDWRGLDRRLRLDYLQKGKRC